MPGDISGALNMHLLMNGAHILKGNQGWVSVTHTDDDIAKSIAAFSKALDGMIADGLFGKLTSSGWSPI